MPLVVRTWNVFHGNTKPPGRRAHLRPMLDLALADDPDILCLQELPVWSLRLLQRWTGRTAISARARPSVFVALPIPSHLGRALTATHHGLLRSAFAGQGIATLVSERFELVDRQTLVLNPTSFRADKVQELTLPPSVSRLWAGERRVAQAAILRDGRAERELVAVNLHATSCQDRRLAAAELHRAAAWAVELADGRPLVLAGDFNVEHGRSDVLDDLERSGFSPAGRGIDHVLAHGLAVERAEAAWPVDSRRLGTRLLSDHAPVDTVLAWP
jgi:endonuclease/exonuclease/phosphatase family metal-dependent hydrolase